MSVHVKHPDRESAAAGLPPDFLERLDTSLRHAESERRRHLLLRRLVGVLPVVLLIGPLVAWRLMLASPDGLRVSIEALAWLAFVLDVGVHIDTAVLAYTHTQAIPSIVGAALAVLLGIRLLWMGVGDE